MKNSETKVLFRVDGNEALGLGHMSRCRSLMAAFCEAARCRFTVATADETAARASMKGCPFCLEGPGASAEQYDIAVTDVPGLPDDELGRIRTRATVLACIDDEGPGAAGQDVLVRPNLLGLPAPAGLPPGRHWSGRDYLILHPAFAACEAVKAGPQPARRLLVCFGGSDPLGLTIRAVPLLKAMNHGIEIRMVVGAAFQREAALRRQVEDDARITVMRNVSEMAEVFYTAGAALISGGTLLYEACCAGVPAAVVSQNIGQHREAVILHEQQAALNVGMGPQVADSDIAAALRKITSDGVLRGRLSRNGPQCVSAGGARRIAAQLLQLR